ncbi:histone deacetylase family protein [Parasphingopyxis sp.]|uniref:histone deacetylase family protein n=1 Tax=Parasphingopyxis sp. TaxID=1920299 RepID=UPI0026324F63|nr:histone deacetylase family protein [Parasphingopyxis sp.]
MITIFDDRQLAHAPERELNNGAWTAYQESPDRARQIAKAFDVMAQPEDFGLDPIAVVHDRAYLGFLRSAYDEWRDAGREGDAIGYAFPIIRRRANSHIRIDAKIGAHSFDAATPITADTWESAYWSAQTALSGLQPVLKGEARSAFALCRPPGHHAGADYMGGYCYLNNAAIAAQAARARADRVAILDIDYHHGNGTQDIFYDRSDVFFASIHADPATDYPYYWGFAEETGAGAGEGVTLNLPLARGAEAVLYRKTLAKALSAISDWGAELLVVSFGADTFAGDPISSFALETSDYAAIGRQVAELAQPTLIVMEGGYAVGQLGAIVGEFLSGF